MTPSIEFSMDPTFTITIARLTGNSFDKGDKVYIPLKESIYSQQNLYLKLSHGVRSKISKADIIIIQVLNEFRVLNLRRFRPQSEIEVNVHYYHL